jgi:DNA-binding beta-propeller fold protein YncE
MGATSGSESRYWGKIVRGIKRGHWTPGPVGRGILGGAALVVAIVGAFAFSTGFAGAVSAHVTVTSAHGSVGVPANLAVAEPKSKSKLKTFTVGEGPQWPAYDPSNHYTYIPESGAPAIQVFSTKDKLVATIPTGVNTYPFAAAFDPGNNYVYVTNDENPGSVWAISGTAVVKNISSATLNKPLGIAYDPGDGVMAIADEGADAVAYIVGTEVIAGVTNVGSDPFDVVYDPFWSTIDVTNLLSDNVSCINAVYLDDAVSGPVGFDPAGIAFSPATNYVYVANVGGSNLTVLGGAGSECGSVGSVSGLTDPYSVAFQGSTLDLFATNFDGKSVVAISSSGAIVKTYATGAEPNGLVYSDYTNDMYATLWDENTGTTVYVIP